ncbi:MAG: hypothetical protein JXX28_05555 [Deltaproteobacteria bacterium]|nr:hypothetical protein [Deltaproteobacteria bacterium]
MLPSDYRLDFVVARLIERLEGTRPSYAGKLEEADGAYARIAEAHVEAALTEFSDLVGRREADAHRDFLLGEVRQTFLPRYARLSAGMTRDEERGHGLGPLAGPLGRIVLVALTLLLLLPLGRFLYLPVSWPFGLALLALPFLPDIVAWLRRRQYLRALSALVEDMGRIQDQASAYLSFEGLEEELHSPHSSARSVPPVSLKQEDSP